MNLIEQFERNDFCIKFAKFVFPQTAADGVIVRTRFATKMYSDCTKIKVVKDIPSEDRKSDVNFMVSCEYANSYSLQDMTFRLDAKNDGSTIPCFNTPVLNVVVRKQINMNKEEVLRKMRYVYNANVLYLTHYITNDRYGLQDLRQLLFDNSIFMVFFHEINYVDVMTPYGNVHTPYAKMESKQIY